MRRSHSTKYGPGDGSGRHAWRLSIFCALFLVLAPRDASAFKLFWIDDNDARQEVTAQNGNCPSPAKSRPVLFVHGHPLFPVLQPGPSFERNWINGTSFKATVELPENQGLDIEDYYIEFQETDRSILVDANKIGQAIALIQGCQDPMNAAGVKLAIVGFSKGTISTRVYLRARDLASQGQDLSSEFPGDVDLMPHSPTVNPVSEFIALASPNHGLSPSALIDDSLPIRQLANGMDRNCDPFNVALANDFMSRLNGTTSNNDWSGAHETPDNRADGDPVGSGTLFLSIYDEDDPIGGSQPDANDCDTPKRKQAFNRGPNAVNIPLDVGGPFTAHNNTPKDAEVICRTLYTLVHHRAPPVDPSPQQPLQICDTVGGLPVIPDGTGLMLALDHSGSMGIPACPGCEIKQSILRDGIALFLSTWQPLAKPQDKVGITYFRTGISQFAAPGSGDTLVQVQSGDSDLVADLQNQVASSSGLTAMGAALQTSLLELRGIDAPLRGVGPNRHVILFTDGLQNVNPRVHDDTNPDFLLENTPGLVDAGIPIQLNTPLAEEGVAIHTIGVGLSSTSHTLLENLATKTGGVSNLDEGMMSLNLFLAGALVQALSNASPQIVAYRFGTLADDQQEEVFTVNGAARQILLRLNWPRGADLSFRVVKDGTDLTDAGTWIEGDFYRIFSLDLPAGLGGTSLAPAGDWRMVIRGPAGTDYEAAAIVDEPALDYRVSLGAGAQLVGEPLNLEARLSLEGRPVEGARVAARVERPLDSMGNLLVAYPVRSDPGGLRFEPASTLGQRAMITAAQDEKVWQALQPATDRLTLAASEPGIYRAAFSETMVPGIYTVTFEIAVPDGQGGTLRRSQTISATLGVGPAVFEASGVTLKPLAETDRGREVALQLAPRDRFGNYLGPDQGDKIGLKVEAGTRRGLVEDLGNGTYRLPLVLPAEEDPPVTLSISGSELFSGPVSALEPKPERSPLLLWLFLALGLGFALALLIPRIAARRAS